FVYFELHLCFIEIRPSLSESCFLVKVSLIELDFQSGQTRVGTPKLRFSIDKSLLDSRVSQFHQHLVGLYLCTGLYEPLFNSSGCNRRNVADLFGNERTQAAYVSRYSAPRNCSGP